MSSGRKEWTLDRFRRASRSHLKSAEHIIDRTSLKGSSDPALIPASAAYLAQVALECGLKARILYRGGCSSTDELERKMPEVHKNLFKGAQGHKIGYLAKHLRCDDLVELEGKPWKEDACWTRITSNDRPYSLRYGAENVEVANVKEELARTSDLLDILLSGIRNGKPNKSRKGQA